MNQKITATHERVDDIPAIIAHLKNMRVAELLDHHFPTNGNWQGLRLGWTTVVWLAFILSEGDHRLSHIEPWVKAHQRTLSRCLGQQVKPRDLTDDRLATTLDYLGVTDCWGAFEHALNQSVLRVYDLQGRVVRVDTTTAAAYVTPDGMFQLGHSKDHRPDLPQVKIAMAVLDPLGLPLTTTVVAGHTADDPLYLPEMAKVRQVVQTRGLTYVGDCKMAALSTRAELVAHYDYYLCPLSAKQMPEAELDTLLTEVHAMIAQTFQDAFSPEWLKTHLTTPTHDLLILRHIIPWQFIMERLVPFSHPHTGRTGHSLRLLVATSLLCRLRQLSDRTVIESIQENRSMQDCCTVPDHRLMTFVHPSTLCRLRKRLGTEGTLSIEEQVFAHRKRAAVIDADRLLMDTTVFESPIMSPTDIRLLDKACDTMAAVATEAQLDRWWDHAHLQQRWRASHLHPKDRLADLSEFSAVFVPAFARFAAPRAPLPHSPLWQRWSPLLAVRTILEEHTQQQLAGHRPIDHRLVSLDARDARPIKKGKSPPSTECGTTLQLTCNRQGCMITTDNVIGSPTDTTLSGPTLERFRKRMHAYPGTAVTDLGVRSTNNLTRNAQQIDHVCMGRSADVEEPHHEACRHARSATEGCLAVATHLRGVARSLSRGLHGAIVWTRLSLCAYNVQTFLQLSRAAALEERTLITLRLSAISRAGAWTAVDRPPKKTAWPAARHSCARKGLSQDRRDRC